MKIIIKAPFLTFLIGIVFSAALVAVQAQSGGGRITTDPKPKSSPNPTTPTKPASTGRTQAGIDRIDGKWWTTGNSFGDSEVVFTQDGSHVNGTIRWADGRTGTVSGTMGSNKRLQFSWSDSRGDGGSGWLELSWANFLGGPWHNQSVRDGSWTLNRIEGKWCFGGKRDRMRTVTHDASGKLTIVMDDGTQEEGHLAGPYLYLHSETGNIKGDMFYKGNRVDWANGTFWTWCGR